MATILRPYTSIRNIDYDHRRADEKSSLALLWSSTSSLFSKEALTGFSLIVGIGALLNLRTIWQWLSLQLDQMGQAGSAKARNITVAELTQSLITSQRPRSNDDENHSINKWLLGILVLLLSPVWLNLAYRAARFLTSLSLESLKSAIDEWNNRLDSRTIERLRKQTNFDAKELRQWHRGFRKDCPDGALDLRQFQNFYGQIFSNGEPDDFAALMFRVFDSDGAGLIDFEKFMLALSVTSRGTSEEKLDWAFKLYDTDGDGMISKVEMLVVITAMYRMVGSQVQIPEDERTPFMRVKKIFKAMDVDGDGFLSLNEFREGSKRDPTIMESLRLYDGVL